MDPERQTILLEVLRERRRQIDAEGWSPDHDDSVNISGELAQAAACYALATCEAGDGLITDPEELSIFWPWPADTFKPKTRRRALILASALLLAEIERLDRMDQK